MRQLSPEELQKLLDTSTGYIDVCRKFGLSTNGDNPETLKRIIKEYNLDTTQLDKNRRAVFAKWGPISGKKGAIPLKDILDGKCPNCKSVGLLRRIVDAGYKEYKCEICGIDEWRGKHISLQLHHINGDNTDHRLENLQILCPNCHSQTDTYARTKRSKDKERKKPSIRKINLPPITREDLKQQIRTRSFRKIAADYGVTDNSVRKWCDKYGLPRRRKDIKKYDEKEWETI